MAATLDATLSGATSNSYVDLAGAEAIANNMPGGPTWVAKTADERTIFDRSDSLARDADVLRYAMQRHAALKWPRKDAKCDGVTSDCAGIPVAIKEAEVALATNMSIVRASSRQRKWRRGGPRHLCKTPEVGIA